MTGMGVGKIRSENFWGFLHVLVSRPQMGHMIKRLYIGLGFDKRIHSKPLVLLLELVPDLGELLCHSSVSLPSIPFSPGQLPQLQRLIWPLMEASTEVFHTLLPYSPVTDLSLPWCPDRLQTKRAFATLLKPSPSKWINRLVRYNGPSYLLEGLSEDAKLLHFCSSNSLSEEALRGFSSKRLLSLHVEIESFCMPFVERHHVSPSLLPSLFPNLQSIAWLDVKLDMVRYFPKSRNQMLTVCLQSSRAFEDPANGPLIAALGQLWDLRCVAFALDTFPDDGESFREFVTDLQDFVQTQKLPLEIIHVWVDSFWTRMYSKQGNTGNDDVTWEEASSERVAPSFVDRW